MKLELINDQKNRISGVNAVVDSELLLHLGWSYYDLGLNDFDTIVIVKKKESAALKETVIPDHLRANQMQIQLFEKAMNQKYTEYVKGEEEHSYFVYAGKKNGNAIKVYLQNDGRNVFRGGALSKENQIDGQYYYKWRLPMPGYPVKKYAVLHLQHVPARYGYEKLYYVLTGGEDVKKDQFSIGLGHASKKFVIPLYTYQQKVIFQNTLLSQIRETNWLQYWIEKLEHWINGWIWKNKP